MAKKFNKAGKGQQDKRGADPAKEDSYESRKGKSRKGREAQSRDYGGNHISWYTASPAMVSDVANIPFNYRIGDAVPTPWNDDYVVPGVMGITYTPTIGMAGDAQSPANVATNIVYANTRRANSGARNYDGVDQMLYFMAMDSVYTGITWFKRALALANTYSMRSRYMPQGVFDAMNLLFDDDFIGNQNVIRARLNQVIAKVTTLAVPAVFPWFERHNFMVSNVYADADSPLAQLYLFTPSVLYQFSLDEYGKGQLLPIQWTNMSVAAQTWRVYMDKLETMVDAIYNDEDTGIITGDILKAYGSNILTVREATADDRLVPIFDPEFLEQIHNATICGPHVLNSSIGTTLRNSYAQLTGITQEVFENEQGLNAYLVQNVFVAEEADRQAIESTSSHCFLDLHNAPSPEWVMRATRLMAGDVKFSEKEEDNNICEVGIYGTEVVNEVTLFYFEGGQYLEYSIMPSVLGDFSNPANVFAVAQSISFSYAPLTGLGSGVSGAIQPSTQITNFTSFGVEQLKMLHQVATLGEFAVDRMSISKL